MRGCGGDVAGWDGAQGGGGGDEGVLLYLAQEVGFVDVEAVAAYHGAEVLAGAAAADVAEFVVLWSVGGGGGDEGLRFAFAEPALGGEGVMG